ncbi:hypothetical protein ACQP2P_10985 [Dactylosporangium sp. CA-139114]|uniref:hypothetical protein n=1 Tax=Dactylosporangium sp. CA-139114 TaxID=3239931 RepID=UPI003D977E88
MTTTSAPAVLSRAGLVRTIAAGVCALTVAAAGAALGAWLGWLGAPALPSDAAVLALVQPAAPDARFTTVARHEAPFAYEHTPGPMTWLIGDDDYNAGGVVLTAGVSPQTLRAGLAAQGWHTSDDPDYEGIAASKGQWSVWAYPAEVDGSPTDSRVAKVLAVDFQRAEPGLVTPLTAAGFLLGLAVGWLLGRRAQRHVLAGALLLLLPGTVITIGDLIAARFLPADVTPPALWGDYLFFGIRALTTAGLLALAVAVVLGLRRGPRPARD